MIGRRYEDHEGDTHQECGAGHQHPAAVVWLAMQESFNLL